MRAYPLPISAGDEAALRDLADRWIELLDRAPRGTRIADLGLTAATGRAALSQRACVVGAEVSELREALARVREEGGEESSGGLPAVRLDTIEWDLDLHRALAGEELVYLEAFSTAARKLGEDADVGGSLSCAASPDALGESIQACVLHAVAATLRSWAPGLGWLGTSAPSWKAVELLSDEIAQRSSQNGTIELPVGKLTRRHLLRAVGAAWERGADVDWQALFPAGAGRTPVPLTPRTCSRIWLENPPAVTPANRPSSGSGVEEPREPAAASGLGAGTWLAAAVAGILGRDSESIPLDVPLVSLGLDSLMAMELREWLIARFGEKGRLDVLEGEASIASIGRRVGELTGDATSAARRPQVEPDPSAARQLEPFGLTDVQRAYWLGQGDDYELGGVSCHFYTEHESEALDVDRLHTALEKLVERHPMLRAVVDSSGAQRVLPEHPPITIATDEGETALAHARSEMSHQVLHADCLPRFEVRAIKVDDRVRTLVSFDLLTVDGPSILRIGSELDRLYADPGAELPALELTFKDYLEADLGGLADQSGSWEYWLGRLDRIPDPPQLPLAVPPEQIETTRFRRRSFVLRAEDAERLKLHARRQSLTASAVLCAAYAEALASFAKEPRFTLNVTTNFRAAVHPQVKHLVGDFTRLLALEVDVASGACFLDRARALQGRLTEDLAHAAIDGMEVMRERLRRSAAAQPGMPVVFTSMLGQLPDDARPPFSSLGKPVFAITQTPQVWLDHQVREHDGTLEASWDVVEGLFPEELIDEAFAYYETLVERLAVDPEAWTSASPVPSTPRHTARVAEANDTSRLVPDGLLHDAVFDRAEELPQAIAVVDDAREITYEELSLEAFALAEALAERGARREEPVAIVMRKGWEQVVAALGILEAGAAYLPIDAGLPDARLQTILEQAGTRLALVQPDFDRDRLGGCEAIEVDGTQSSRRTRSAGRGGADDLAYVIFTSGSTGTPKGVMIEHGAALNTVSDINGRFRIDAGDAVLGISSMSFDLSVWDVFGALSAGGKLVLPTVREVPDPADWVEAVERNGVTVWNSVPALASLLVEHLRGRDGELPDSLRLLMMSGDWIPVSLPDGVRKLHPGTVEIASLGGATEASIWSIHYPIREVDPEWESIPYGKALANQSFHVLDWRGAERPVWVPGPLHIGGSGVARGYWGAPELTEASFWTHAESGERLYATGDLGRWLPDGNIEFLGREDGQVKVNGFRVELGEVEATLARLAGVQAAIAAVQGSRLVAGVTVRTGSEADTEQLRAAAASELPSYMVPAAVWIIDEIPLTANGKVDRDALRPPGADPAAGDEDDDSLAGLATLAALGEGGTTLVPDIESISRLSARIAERRGEAPDAEPLLSAVIGRGMRSQVAKSLGRAPEEIKVSERFEQLGLDSLGAVRLRNLVEAETGLRVPLRRLAGESSIAALSTELTCRARERAADPTSLESLCASLRRPEGGAEADSRPEGSFPLNDIQSAYVVGRNPAFPLGGVACHLYCEFESGSLDTRRLESALRALVQRHPMLRAVIDVERGTQRVLAEVPEVDVPVGEGEQTAARWRQELETKVADPSGWPLFDLRVVQLGTGSRALLSFDLLVADGPSLTIFMEELKALYRDPSVLLQPLGLTFRDYVLAEAASEGDEEWQRSWRYWEELLEDLPEPPSLPLAIEPAELRRPVFERLAHRISPGDSAEFEKQCARRRVTPSAALCTAFAEELARETESPAFALNVTTYSRTPLHADVESLVGDFTATAPLTVDCAAGKKHSFAAHAASVGELLLENLEHSRVPGFRVMRELLRARGRPAKPFPVVFTSLLTHTQAVDPSSGPLGEMTYALTQTPQVWLDHQVLRDRDGILLTWDYVPALFPGGLIGGLFDAYSRRIQGLAGGGQYWERTPAETPRRGATPASGVRSRASPPEARRDELCLDAATIQTLVAELLGVEDVDPSRSLFELGMPSMELVRLIDRLEALTGVRFGVDDQFVIVPVAELPEHLAARGRRGP